MTDFFSIDVRVKPYVKQYLINNCGNPIDLSQLPKFNELFKKLIRKPLYHTKLLKLLFLIDQESTLRTGAPLTWLNYNAWSLGPVPEDFFYSKINGHNKFSEFVDFEKAGENKCILKPKAEFDDSEFSELDLEIIDDIIATYGHKKSAQLVAITLAKGSLWSKIKESHHLQFSRKNETSSIPVDFFELVKNDPLKKSVYYASLENREI